MVHRIKQNMRQCNGARIRESESMRKIYGIDLEKNQTVFLFTWIYDSSSGFDRARREQKDFGCNFYAFYSIDENGVKRGCQNYWNLSEIPPVVE